MYVYQDVIESEYNWKAKHNKTQLRKTIKSNIDLPRTYVYPNIFFALRIFKF